MRSVDITETLTFIFPIRFDVAKTQDYSVSVEN